MASRYPTVKVVDYCFHPIHVVDDDKDIIVPCGKCDGCLLHAANVWSMRCGMEIEATPATIFGTLTYSNRYYPKLYPVVGSSNIHQIFDNRNVDFSVHYDDCLWISDHSDNIRFNGVRDVLREDHYIIKNKSVGVYEPIEIQNWDNFSYPAIGYASKRDIQLWLKLLRKSIQENIFCHGKRVKEIGYFRYFVISEVGPTTFRCHYHFLIFCQSQEIAAYLLGGALYKNWKMCNEDRFTKYCHLCDSGARGYVTQYLTSFSGLPRVYKENKEIRPFRLASKAPAIGYIEQDKKKIFEDVANGTINYSRAVRRLESASLLQYPSDFLFTLFPKCYRFDKISDSRRYLIYSYLYRATRKYGYSYYVLRERLCQVLQSSDYLATCACYRFCQEFVASPDYYYFLLDSYYYQLSMAHLRSFYKSQEDAKFQYQDMRIFEYYSNVEQLACCDSASRYYLTLKYFLDSLGFNVDDVILNKEFFEDVHEFIKSNRRDYENEVKSIVDGMVKTSKFNEYIGDAPTIV